MEPTILASLILFIVVVIFLPIHLDFIFSHIRRHHRKLKLAFWVKWLSYLPILVIIGAFIWGLTLDREKDMKEVVEYCIYPAFFSAVFLTAMYGAVIFYIGYGVSGLEKPLIIALGVAIVEVLMVFADGFWQSILALILTWPVWNFASHEYKKLRETRKYWRRDIDEKAIDEDFKPEL